MKTRPHKHTEVLKSKVIRKRKSTVKVSEGELDALVERAIAEYLSLKNQGLEDINNKKTDFVLSAFSIRIPLFVLKADQKRGENKTLKYSFNKPFLWKHRSQKYVYEANYIRNNKKKLVIDKRRLSPCDF